MSITELREDLRELRAYLREGRTDEALGKIDQALQELEGERLLTTTEAASLLGIRSVNTLKLLCRRGDICYVTRGNRTMIPLAELERVQESDPVRRIRILDKMHEETSELGSSGGMTEEQMEALHQSRPGTSPWER